MGHRMKNRIYVGNLSYEVTTESLRTAFAECGDVRDVQIVVDRDYGRSRGFAFVTMASEAEAQYATSRLNGAIVDGRALRLSIADESHSRGGQTS